MVSIDNELELVAMALSMLLLFVVCAVCACKYYLGQRVCCFTIKTVDRLKLPVQQPLYKRVEVKSAVLPMLGQDDPEQKVKVGDGNSRQCSSEIELVQPNYDYGRHRRLQGELSIPVDSRVLVREISHLASIDTASMRRQVSDNSSSIFKPPNTNYSCNQTTDLTGETTNLKGERTHRKSAGATLGPNSSETGKRVSQLWDSGSEGAQSSLIVLNTGEAESTSPVRLRDKASVWSVEAWPGKKNPELRSPLSQSESFWSLPPVPSGPIQIETSKSLSTPIASVSVVS